MGSNGIKTVGFIATVTGSCVAKAGCILCTDSSAAALESQCCGKTSVASDADGWDGVGVSCVEGGVPMMAACTLAGVLPWSGGAVLCDDDSNTGTGRLCVAGSSQGTLCLADSS